MKKPPSNHLWRVAAVGLCFLVFVSPATAGGEWREFWSIDWPKQGTKYRHDESQFRGEECGWDYTSLFLGLAAGPIRCVDGNAYGIGWVGRNSVRLCVFDLFSMPFVQVVDGQRIDLGDYLAPDMKVWASERDEYLYGWCLDTSTTPGRTLLRLTTAIPNIGTGPVEIRGGTVNPDGTQDVFQRLMKSDGSFTDVYAGKFVYHPSHGHIHFDGYAIYRLRERTAGDGVGPIVAEGDKVSFCLIDIDRYASLPGSPGSPRYRSCGQVQGISVGWADVYNKSLPDQWIDITGISAGSYWLEVEIDPDNQLVESNEDNNIERIPIDL